MLSQAGRVGNHIQGWDRTQTQTSFRCQIGDVCYFPILIVKAHSHRYVSFCGTKHANAKRLFGAHGFDQNNPLNVPSSETRETQNSASVAGGKEGQVSSHRV